MRRLFLLGLCVVLVASACARPGSGSTPGTPDVTTAAGAPGGATPAGSPAGTREADIYAAVLRRYLTHPTENSFPGFTFPVVYVLARTDVNAGGAGHEGGTSPGPDISAGDQERIIAGLRDAGTVQFIADRTEVIVNTDGCAQVRDGGILIVLAPPKGEGDDVEVGIHGFVACLGATWFTYVVHHDTGGWRVTGTTGPAAIA